MQMNDDMDEICCSPVHGCGIDQAGSGDMSTIEGALANGQLSGPVVMTDALGLTWCQACRQRGDLVNWGASHDFRALEIEPYAIAEGAYFYHVAATMGSDEMIWMMIGLTEMLEKEQVA